MQGLKKAKQSVQRITYYTCAASMFILLPLMLLTTADVTGRAILGQPVTGAVELSEYMLAVVILLGMAYTQQAKGHPRVTFIVNRLSQRLQLCLEAATNILAMFIIFIVMWQGWVAATGPMSTIVSAVLEIPQLPFRLLVSIGAALLFLELLVDLATALEKLIHRTG